MAVPVFVAMLLLLTAIPAAACSPLPPVLLIIGGSPMSWGGYAAGLLHSMYIFVGIIFVKCLLFAYKEKNTGGFIKACIVMGFANFFSTIPGVFIAILISVPSFLIFSPVVLFAINHFSARVLSPQFSQGNDLRSPSILNIAMIGLTYLSGILFYMSQGVLDVSTGVMYWLSKIAFTFTAICVALALTIGYEGSIAIGSYKKQNREPRAILQSVAWANVWTMFIATGIAAAAMLPRRFESGDFLVRLIEQLRALFA